ncbi:IS5 family transposase, partial [Francisella tularensis subsp. holarctica]
TISEYIGMIKLACTFIWLLRNYFCAQNLAKLKSFAKAEVL